ncbi:MAG: carbohydrate ABC transporter permease [Caldilineaceae bacterium]|nr:carbohydrate ABC transporter permease [Caldilineaceae bacterium]MDE0183105.1 carbohydrate ABC transporter permease [Caldilineaceae bacterium]
MATTVTGGVSSTTDARSLRRKAERTRALERSVIHVILLVGSISMLFPLYWMISTSLKPQHEVFLLPPTWFPSEFQWIHYRQAFVDYFSFAQYGTNTMIITLGVLVGRLLSASLVAFGFARIRFIGRDVIFILVLSTMMVPGQVTIIPLYILFKDLGWLNTFYPLIVPSWFGGGAFFIFLLRQFILTINPELDDAARIDGCGWLGIYGRITMPLIKPALAAVAIFSFLGTWNDFFGPLIFLRSRDMLTLAVGLHFMATAASSSVRPNLPHLMAGSTMILIPPLLVFFFAQRYFIQGVTFSGIKG